MSTKKADQEAEDLAQSLFQNGLTFLQQGKMEEADHLFEKAYQLNPNNIDTLNLLGIRSYQKHEYENAIRFLNSANSLAPNAAHTLSNLGLVYNALSQFHEALHHFNLSLISDPEIPETHNNLGNTFKGLKRNREAITSYDKAIFFRPNYAEALTNKGIVYLEEGLYEQAITLFKQAINADSSLAEPFNSLGNALTELGKYEDAFQSFEHALQLNPNYLDACLNFGNSLKKAKHYDGAIQCYEHALKINSTDAKAFYFLAELYYEIGDSSLAQTYYTKSLALAPLNLEAEYGLVISQAPKVYKSSSDIAASRTAFSKGLDYLQTLPPSKCSPEIISKAIARHPFYLAYQAENNRELLAQFGRICTKQALPLQEGLRPIRRVTQSNKKIRIGIISKFFCDHPVWHAITKGWINHINTEQFELFIFNTGGTQDEETEIAKSKAAHYLHCSKVVELTAQEILNQDLDVILYPEIGMDPSCKALACLRLAPLQAVSWGHPETTGLPTIDFFLSADLLEPHQAGQYYSEKLICLPNLGTHFEWPLIDPKEPNLLELGIDKKIPILICAGSPSKYLPTHDVIFVEIAKRLGKCQFVFFNFDEHLSNILKQRFNQSFAAAQLDAEQFFHFIPFQKKDAFFGLMGIADLYLDTVGFSGFNTAMQALMCDLPVITIEGQLMRGRLASGILNKLDLRELICKDADNYADLAVNLIQDQNKLKSYKALINANKMNLFNDLSPIRALENFLIQNVQK